MSFPAVLVLEDGSVIEGAGFGAKKLSVGEIVFNMVEHKLLSKTDEDSREDFRSIYTFKEAFERPFRPQKPRSVESGFSKGLKKPGTKV